MLSIVIIAAPPPHCTGGMVPMVSQKVRCACPRVLIISILIVYFFHTIVMMPLVSVISTPMPIFSDATVHHQAKTRYAMRAD